MGRIIVFTHGYAGIEIVNTVKMIMGDLAEVSALAFETGESLEEAEAKLSKLLEDCQGNSQIRTSLILPLQQ